MSSRKFINLSEIIMILSLCVIGWTIMISAIIGIWRIL